MVDWQKINKSSEIPENVLQATQAYTKGKIVIDFGSGVDALQHVNFFARETIRIEKGLPIGDPEVIRTFGNQIFEVTRHAPAVIVFFRVLSILSVAELLDVSECLTRAVGRIEHVIIYDYAIDERKRDEYFLLQSRIGPLHRPSVEWSEQDFFHFSEKNLTQLVPLPLLSSARVWIPAHKRSDGRGIFMVFADQARPTRAA
jgi:hypothetical protein